MALHFSIIEEQSGRLPSVSWGLPGPAKNPPLHGKTKVAWWDQERQMVSDFALTPYSLCCLLRSQVPRYGFSSIPLQVTGKLTSLGISHCQFASLGMGHHKPQRSLGRASYSGEHGVNPMSRYSFHGSARLFPLFWPIGHCEK